MPQDAWSSKRERQYEAVRRGLLERGERRERAEEIAAGTVNKERARRGEARGTSRPPQTDPSGRRGGARSRQGPGGRTRDQLYEEAKALDIPGRSKMSKSQLRQAVDRRRGRRAS